MQDNFKLCVAACYKCAAFNPPLQHITFNAFSDGLIIDHIEEKVGIANMIVVISSDSGSN